MLKLKFNHLEMHERKQCKQKQSESWLVFMINTIIGWQSKCTKLGTWVLLLCSHSCLQLALASWLVPVSLILLGVIYKTSNLPPESIILSLKTTSEP